MASRVRGVESGRGRGGGTRAVGRPRSRPRRRGGRGRLPRTVRCPDPRSGAAGAARARRRAGQGARRRVRRRSGAAGDRAGRAARRRRAGTRRPGAGEGLLRHRPAATRHCRCCWPPPAGSNRSTRGLARDTYLDALSAALFAGRRASGPGARQVAEAARQAPSPAPPRKGDALLDGLAVLFTDGYSRAAPLSHRAVQAFAAEELTLDEALRFSSARRGHGGIAVGRRAAGTFSPAGIWRPSGGRVPSAPSPWP